MLRAPPVAATHDVQELTYLLVAGQQVDVALPSQPTTYCWLRHIPTWLLKPDVPPAKNTLPLKAPDAEP